VSVSRLKRYEQCPRAFALQYIDKAPRDTDPTFTTRFDLDLHEGADFGSLIHTTLETIFRWVVQNEFQGSPPEDVITKSYRDAFQASAITGNDTFGEGRDLLRVYFDRHPIVDHLSVLDVEREFRIQREGVTLLGYIDRVDKIDDETIRIVDYKTNRMLFSRDDVDTDLQMSIYGVAAKTLYPWAKRVEYAFDMIRHDIRMTTERDESDLQEASDYVVALTQRIEAKANDPLELEKTFPAVLNGLCHWCGQNDRCSEFQRAMGNDANHDALELPIPIKLDDVARERERVAALARIYDNRKKVLDRELKSHLKKSEQPDLLIGGYKYRMINGRATKTYPPKRTLAVFKQVAQMTEEQLRDALFVVSNKGVEGLIKSLEIDRKAKAMLKTNLEAIADVSRGAPWLDSRVQKAKLGGD
jgi:RecB family exonuclease